MADWWFSKGKGCDVDGIVTKRRQNQERCWTESKGSGKVDKIAPTKELFKDGIQPSRDPNPPSQDILVETFRTECPQKVSSRPSVVACVELGAKVPVAMPSFGVNNKVQLD